MAEDGDPAAPDSPEAGDPPAQAASAEDLEELIQSLEGEVVDDDHRSSDESSLRAVRTVRTLFHSGPLPSSEWFSGVERIEPGTTKSIIEDFLLERQHQRDLQGEALALDKESFRAFSRYQSLQLAAAWTLAVLFASAGIILIATGHQIGGLVWLVIEIAVLAGVFLDRRVSRPKSPGPPEEVDGP